MGMVSREVPKVWVRSRHRDECHLKSQGSEANRCECPKQLLWSANGKLKRVSAQTDDWQIAEKKAQDMEDSFEKLAAGEIPSSNNHKTLDETVTLFLETKQGKNVTDKHIAKLRYELKVFTDFANGLGLIYLADIKTEDVLRYRNSLKGAQNTRAKKVFRLIGFFEFCVEMGWITRNIARADAIVIPYDKNQDPKALSDAQFEQLFASVPKVNGKTTDEQRAKLRSLVLLMRWTGLAIRDAVTIERSRFEKVNGMYRLFLRRAKTDKPVYCTLMPEIAETILSSPQTGRYLFVDNVPMGERELDSLIQIWSNLMSKLSDVSALKDEDGDPVNFTSHMLRHTFVRWCLDMEIPTEDIAMLIGDTLQIVARHYQTWVEGRQKRLTERMTEALKRQLAEVATAGN